MARCRDRDEHSIDYARARRFHCADYSRLYEFKVFPLYSGYGLLVRVFSFNTHETTIMDEELFGHENPNDKEPIAVWIILMMR